MRVKCANCGMIYDINPTSTDFTSKYERFSCAQCPGCKSNAKDKLPGQTWIDGSKLKYM